MKTLETGVFICNIFRAVSIMQYLEWNVKHIILTHITIYKKTQKHVLCSLERELLWFLCIVLYVVLKIPSSYLGKRERERQ